MTLAELRGRMTHREWVEQMEYDEIKREAGQEATLDRQLSADHKALMRRLN